MFLLFGCGGHTGYDAHADDPTPAVRGLVRSRTLQDVARERRLKTGLDERVRATITLGPASGATPASRRRRVPRGGRGRTGRRCADCLGHAGCGRLERRDRRPRGLVRVSGMVHNSGYVTACGIVILVRIFDARCPARLRLGRAGREFLPVGRRRASAGTSRLRRACRRAREPRSPGLDRWNYDDGGRLGAPGRHRREGRARDRLPELGSARGRTAFGEQFFRLDVAAEDPQTRGPRVRVAAEVPVVASGPMALFCQTKSWMNLFGCSGLPHPAWRSFSTRSADRVGISIRTSAKRFSQNS